MRYFLESNVVKMAILLALFCFSILKSELNVFFWIVYSNFYCRKSKMIITQFCLKIIQL